MSLPTSRISVETLRNSLQAKAKSEPSYRFYSLWDKMYREDVLREAYRRNRANAGVAGVDGVGFEHIEALGVEQWLGALREELRSKTYLPQPLLRVWIPKRNGGQRPLGIPTVKDRVVQSAAVLVLGAIFDADLLPQQYGFRPKVDAKMAVRRAYFHITRHNRREVVDADLSDYFTTIPHGPLMKCLSRRVADGQVLSVIKSWLTAPVCERIGGKLVRSTEARDRRRGTPQGGAASPLFANLYFRRFILAWEAHGHQRRLDAHIVNYADDLVICCRAGSGAAALATMRRLMERLGLTVNETKTRIARVPEESFDFLGYTIGQFYARGGRAFIGTNPSRKSLKRIIEKIHDETSRRWNLDSAEHRVAELNALIRGWAGYFNQGRVIADYRVIQQYTARRLRRWLMGKRGKRGTGYRQYPDGYLYEKLGLYRLPESRTAVANAKA